jgi:hypothetical protein
MNPRIPPEALAISDEISAGTDARHPARGGGVTMRPPDQRKGPGPGRDQAGAETQEASNLKAKDSTAVIALPTGWPLAMRRAHAIGRYRRGPLQVAAVRRWRAAVQDALVKVRR